MSNHQMRTPNPKPTPVTATSTYATWHTKRPRGTPTLQTPVRPKKRVPLRFSHEQCPPPSSRQLSFPDTRQEKQEWSEAEVKALVQFVMFHTDGELWPTHKRPYFWHGAAEFVKQRACTSFIRSGMLVLSSRNSVLSHM